MFPLRICSGNVNASGVVICQCPQIYFKKSLRKTSLFVLFELLPHLQVFLSIYDILLPHSMNGFIILCFYCQNINEKVGEVGKCQVFSLRHKLVLFSLRRKLVLFSKTTSKKMAVMQLLINCGENRYKKPVKKLISRKVEAAVL